jgi:hypothetical protein
MPIIRFEELFIAQELPEIFPEHVQKIKSFHLTDKKLHLTAFHQVDKQPLTFDLLAALQSQAKRFQIWPQKTQTPSVAVLTDDAKDPEKWTQETSWYLQEIRHSRKLVTQI